MGNRGFCSAFPHSRHYRRKPARATLRKPLFKRQRFLSPQCRFVVARNSWDRQALLTTSGSCARGFRLADAQCCEVFSRVSDCTTSSVVSNQFRFGYTFGFIVVVCFVTLLFHCFPLSRLRAGASVGYSTTSFLATVSLKISGESK